MRKKLGAVVTRWEFRLFSPIRLNNSLLIISFYTTIQNEYSGYFHWLEANLEPI
jgi:hypothetical protein